MSDKSIIDRLEELENKKKNKKDKELKLSSKGKVKGAKLRKGYIGILKVDENGNITPTKKRIEGSVFDFDKENYHATNGSEVLFWKGKFPVIIQPTWERNPLVVKDKNTTNKTYGDEYILAKLQKDVLKTKKKMGGLVIILVVGVLLFVIGKFVFKWF